MSEEMPKRRKRVVTTEYTVFDPNDPIKILKTFKYAKAAERYANKVANKHLKEQKDLTELALVIEKYTSPTN